MRESMTVMKGKDEFSYAESDAIRKILREIRKADRKTQKKLRNLFCRQYEFYISDFERSNNGFTEDGFNELIREGKVRIKHIESFGYVWDQCVWLRTCYNIFESLFDSDDKTGKLLQSVSHKFFDNLNGILIVDEKFYWYYPKFFQKTDRKMTINDERLHRSCGEAGSSRSCHTACRAAIG